MFCIPRRSPWTLQHSQEKATSNGSFVPSNNKVYNEYFISSKLRSNENEKKLARNKTKVACKFCKIQMEKISITACIVHKGSFVCFVVGGGGGERWGWQYRYTWDVCSGSEHPESVPNQQYGKFYPPGAFFFDVWYVFYVLAGLATNWFVWGRLMRRKLTCSLGMVGRFGAFWSRK